MRWLEIELYSYFILNSITSLSLRAWLSPIVCPGNFEEGPQIFAFFIFFDIPFRIFSAASFRVEPCFIIIGSLVGSLPGSLV